jgi:glyoxylase-like metal-dependent hydrolase (beta-lactamase superfamily II)
MEAPLPPCAETEARIKSVFTLKYAESENLPNYAVFFMGEPRYSTNQPNPRTFMYYWLIRTDTQNILVDAGMRPEMASQRNYKNYVTPDLTLGEVGLKPSDIDTIIVTHAHWDHVDALELFPNSRVYIQRACYRFTVEEGVEQPFFRKTGYPTRRDSFALLTLMWDSRLRLIDGDATLLPGIHVIKVDGHYPGLQIVVVDAADRRIVLASDSLHLYRNLEEDHPMGLCFGNLSDLLKAFDTLRRLNGITVPGHDPEVMARFKSVGKYAVQIYP